MPFFYKFGVKTRNDGQKGLYALEPIPKGSIIWKLNIQQGVQGVLVEGLPNPQPYLLISDEQIQTMEDQSLLKDIAHCAYNKKSDENTYILTRDGFQYQNHSLDPNVRVSETEDNQIAIRDIEEGEEIFHDYNILGVFTRTFQKLMLKYDKETYDFTIDLILDKSWIIPINQL